jgi:hypothetical protein
MLNVNDVHRLVIHKSDLINQSHNLLPLKFCRVSAMRETSHSGVAEVRFCTLEEVTYPLFQRLC